MARQMTPPEVIEKIKTADFKIPHHVLAEQLEVSVPTVRKYRAEAREERKQACKDKIVQHVEENVTDFLGDLVFLRRVFRAKIARNEYKASHFDGRLLLDVVKTTAVLLGAADKKSEFDEVSDDDLRAILREELGVTPEDATPDHQ